MEAALNSGWMISEIATPAKKFTFRQNPYVSFPELAVDDAATKREQKRARKQWEKEKDVYFRETVVGPLAFEVLSDGERVALGGNEKFEVIRATPLEVILLADNDAAIAALVTVLD